MKRFALMLCFVASAIFALALPVATFAADETVFIPAEQTTDGNLIKFANVIDLRGPINGDVIVAGNIVTISGPVAGSVYAAGSTVTIKGPVAGSVYAAGSTVIIESTIAHNLWTAGSAVRVDEGAQVGWDVFGAGASIDLAGKVGGNVKAGTATLLIGNEVGKDVWAALDQDGKVVVGPAASVKGSLTYESAKPEQLIVQNGGVVTGATQHKPLERHAATFGGAFLFFIVIKFFALLVIGVLLVGLVPRIMHQVKDVMVSRPAASLGWGLIYFIVVPVVAILSMVTLIGIPLGIIALVLYVLSLYLSAIFVGFTIGHEALLKITKGAYRGSVLWSLVLGLVIYFVIGLIPVVGFLVHAGAVLWALGALLQVKRTLIQQYR